MGGKAWCRIVIIGMGRECLLLCTSLPLVMAGVDLGSRRGGRKLERGSKSCRQTKETVIRLGTAAQGEGRATPRDQPKGVYSSGPFPRTDAENCQE